MWADSEISRQLGIIYPIIQGPFGGGLSSPQLVASVCEAGGLGSYGANHLPADKISEVIAEIRNLTNKPFAINLWVPNRETDHSTMNAEAFEKNAALLAPYYEQLGIDLPAPPGHFGQDFETQVAAVLAAKPALLSFVFGIPSIGILQACRDRGILAAGTATTVDEAVAIEAAGFDFVVASGFEAGGHRGSFLKPAEESLVGTFALVPQVASRVGIPVIAAGGIADGRGIAATLALGAMGVQIGTAFLACDDSGTNELHREMLVSGRAGDTVLSRAFSGHLARGIRNGFIDAMRPFETQLPGYPAQNWFTSQLRPVAVARGRSDLIALSAGQATALVRRSSASRLVEELVGEVEQILATPSRSARGA
jgi:nitronate monooxygenase